jgi:hypothetical protein
VSSRGTRAPPQFARSTYARTGTIVNDRLQVSPRESRGRGWACSCVMSCGSGGRRPFSWPADSSWCSRVSSRAHSCRRAPHPSYGPRWLAVWPPLTARSASLMGTAPQSAGWYSRKMARASSRLETLAVRQPQSGQKATHRPEDRTQRPRPRAVVMTLSSASTQAPRHASDLSQPLDTPREATQPQRGRAGGVSATLLRRSEGRCWRGCELAPVELARVDHAPMTSVVAPPTTQSLVSSVRIRAESACPTTAGVS